MWLNFKRDAIVSVVKKNTQKRRCGASFRGSLHDLTRVKECSAVARTKKNFLSLLRHSSIEYLSACSQTHQCTSSSTHRSKAHLISRASRKQSWNPDILKPWTRRQTTPAYCPRETGHVASECLVGDLWSTPRRGPRSSNALKRYRFATPTPFSRTLASRLTPRAASQLLPELILTHESIPIHQHTPSRESAQHKWS